VKRMKAARLTVKEMQDAGYGLREMKALGYKPKEMQEAGYKLNRLLEFYSAEEFENGGLSAFGLEAVEVREGSWNAAANAIVQELKRSGVRRGQVVSIDAHNNGPDEPAMFSAHFSKWRADGGELDIEFWGENGGEPWSKYYGDVAEKLNREPADVISITSSCNAGGRGVTYVFLYKPAKAGAPQRNVVWVDARRDTWEAAAAAILEAIRQKGAERGQVLSIDMHVNHPGEQPRFSAFIDLGAPGLGPLDLTYLGQVDETYGWATFYQVSHYLAAGVGCARDVVSMTFSISQTNSSAAFVFVEQSTVKRMKAARLTAKEVQDAGYGLKEMVALGYTPQDMQEAGCGISGPELLAKSAFTMKELTAMGFSRLGLEALEVREETWNKAADAIIQRLQNAGIQRGQVVSIDAHNNGPDDKAIFSAHYSKLRKGEGALDIVYSRERATQPWANFYRNAADKLSSGSADVISITSSCSSYKGECVTYVFQYAPTEAKAMARRNVVWVEAESGSWEEAAEAIMQGIREKGAERGQILGIDAHSLAGKRAYFSAFLDLGAPSLGPLDLLCASQVDQQYGWARFYDMAHLQASDLGPELDDVISITGTISGLTGSYTSSAFVFMGRAHASE